MDETDAGDLPAQTEGEDVGDLSQQNLFFAAVRLRRMALVFSDPNQPDNPIVYCNPAFTEQTGYPPEEVIGRNCRFLQGPATDRNAVRRIREAVAAGQGVSEELFNYRRDGRGFWNALYVSPVVDEEGQVRYFLGSQVDVTQRKEEALQQQSRLDTVGMMASSVAHEFSRLMTDVAACIAEAGTAAVDERQRGLLGQAGQAADQAGRLTRQMFSFTCRQFLDRQDVDINDVVRDLDSLLAQVAGPGVDLSLDLSPAPSAVNLDPGQLELALVQLVRNASEAMPGGGRCAIRVWEYRAWDSAAGRRGRGWVELAVSDDGEGMPYDVAERAVEPFFTTKRGGKGVGLALTEGFVERCGGRMQIESSPGRGTTVRLAFPRVE